MFPLSDTDSSGKFPFWSIAIILLNVFVFVFQLFSPNPDSFIARYAIIPANISFLDINSLYPFISSQFLHGGFIHIISNMWFLWIFGDNVEDRFGLFLYPLFYLTCGFIAGLTQYFIDPTSTIPIIGASGAIAGVLGAYMASFPNHTVKTLVPFFGFLTVVNMPAFIVLVMWFITQLFSGSASILSTQTTSGGVAFFAHIGGFVSGWILAKMFNSIIPQPALNDWKE